MLIEDPVPYIKEGDPSASCLFINTCVPDSIIAANHTASIKDLTVEDLLNKDDFFNKLLSLLKEKKYIEARKHFVKELHPDKINLFGTVKDYLPLFDKLACAEITYNQNPPNDSAIYKEIPSILKKCGDVIVLGNPSDPTLLLVHRDVNNALYRDYKSTEPPLSVDDEKKRTFMLQFLLLGKEEHMTTCFSSFDGMWHLYDNDPRKPSFQPFDLESLKDYDICLAGYVNISQEQECKLGVAETGVGAKPHFSHLEKAQEDPSRNFYPQQSVVDVEMEDLSGTISYSVADTGGGRLGAKPFIEDTEMPSCSSSDSD